MLNQIVTMSSKEEKVHSSQQAVYACWLVKAQVQGKNNGRGLNLLCVAYDTWWELEKRPDDKRRSLGSRTANEANLTHAKFCSSNHALTSG